MTIQIEFLKASPYFSGLNDVDLSSISKFLFEKVVDRGEIIFFEGEPVGVLYFVGSGVVKIFKTSSDGKEQILRLVRPGESFNDVPVFSSGSNLVSAEAMGRVIFYGIKKSDVEKILRSYPQISLNIIRVLSRRVEYLVSLVEDLSFRNVTGRVAKVLLEYAGDGTSQNPRLTQQEMAAIAGTAREMVGRSLKSLDEEGTIRLDRHRIVITNRKALQEIAGVTS
ncbi:Crp/Fnr family transcriptional regulator [Chloroflexota bacterium]